MNGKFDGGLDIQGVVHAGLETQLKKLSSECDSASHLSIEYYATDLPEKNPTNLEDLVKLIQEFPSRLKKINEGKGVPIQVGLVPLSSPPIIILLVTRKNLVKIIKHVCYTSDKKEINNLTFAYPRQYL